MPILAINAYNANISYGTRLSASPTDQQTNNSESTTNFKKLRRAPVALPFEHYDVEMNPATRMELVNQGHSSLFVSAKDLLENTAPTEIQRNFISRPIIESSAEPIVVNFASHPPGFVESHRRPMMVDSMRANTYHLPPLSAALPMNQFQAFAMSLLEPHNSATGHIALQAVPSFIHHTPNQRKPKVAIQYEHTGHLLSDSHNIPVSITHSRGLYQPEVNVQSDYVPGIPGKAWKDYPMFASVPQTSFSCSHASYGYYADMETGCQTWHYCQPDGRHSSFVKH